MNLTLQNLFDLQCFEENPRLQALINDSMERYGLSERASLSEQELSMLYAAGDPCHASDSASSQKTEELSSFGHTDLFSQKESH